MTIEQRQCLLKYLRYYKGNVDDTWGPQSQAATEEFQRQHNLEIDGVWGPVTEAQVLSAVANGEFAQEPEEANPDTNAGGDGAPAWWNDIKYFRRDEPYIGCSCGKCGGFPVEPSETLMRLAVKVRSHVGKPLVPNSTVRCATHNARVGGVFNSKHLTGKAMDFHIPGMPASLIIPYIKAQKECSYVYAITNDDVHMDVY